MATKSNGYGLLGGLTLGKLFISTVIRSGIVATKGFVGLLKLNDLGTKRQEVLLGNSVYTPRINFRSSTISKVVMEPDLFASAAIIL